MYYITINVQYVCYSTGRKIKYFIVYRYRLSFIIILFTFLFYIKFHETHKYFPCKNADHVKRQDFFQNSYGSAILHESSGFFLTGVSVKGSPSEVRNSRDRNLTAS
jgi:hypothetical protein